MPPTTRLSLWVASRHLWKPPFQLCLWALSTSVCILLGTAPSGNVCASSHHYPRGLGRYPQSETWHGFNHPEFTVPGKSMAECQVMGPSWGKGHRLGLGQAGKVRMPMAVVKWHEHLTGSRATPLWFQICYIPHWLSDPLAHHSPLEGPQDLTQLHVSSVLGFGTRQFGSHQPLVSAPPTTAQGVLPPEASPGSPEAVEQVLRQARRCGSPRATGLCCMGPPRP